MKKTTLILGAAGVALALACSGGGDDETISVEAPAVEEPTEEPAAEEPAAEEAAVAPASADPEPPARERKIKKGSKTKGR